MPQPPSQVLDYLFIGSVEDSIDHRFLTRFGITHIVNVTPDLPILEVYQDRSLRVPIKDSFDQDIISHFDSVIEFIRSKTYLKILFHSFFLSIVSL